MSIENSSVREGQQIPSLDNPGNKLKTARVYNEPFFWCYDFSSLNSKKEKYQKIASDLNSIIPILSNLGICTKENILMFAESSRSEDKEVELKNLKNTFIAEAASLLEGTSTVSVVVSTLQFKEIVDQIDSNICIPEFDETIVSWNGSSFVVNEEPIKKECEVWVDGDNLEAWNETVEFLQALNKLTASKHITSITALGNHLSGLAIGNAGVIPSTVESARILLNRTIHSKGKILKW